MAEYDDDERRAAYQRACDYAEFANIVQHFDDTARGNHDDIDYDSPDDHDGAEYDNNGERVLIVNIAGVLDDICSAIEQFGNFNDIPDDYDFGYDDDWDDDDDSETCRYIFLLGFARRDPSQCDRNYPYVAPGDDDNDPGSQGA